MKRQMSRRDFVKAGVAPAALMLLDHRAFATPNDETKDLIADRIVVSGIELKTASLPPGLLLDPKTGLVMARPITSQIIYRSPTHAWEVRGTITPKGDYLVMAPIGEHYGPPSKVNYLAAFRSRDRGKTWTGPTDPMKTAYSMHGFIPLIPKGSARLYAFGTQAFPALLEGKENAPIGFRFSDDDGYTWSEVHLIKPEHDPNFKGMSVMRMCETASGVWLLGSHEATWQENKLLSTRQYVLRSTDQGKTWTVLPHPRPQGWYVASKGRMDEGRPISLGGDHVLLMIRTPEGHLWASWSDDAGMTWSTPEPTSLIHPDAPPMLFHMPDGKTLACFHHNSSGDWKKGRSEVWVSFSTDGGHHWTAPRFVLAIASVPNTNSGFYDYQCSYLDAFCDGGQMHLFFPLRWNTVTHLIVKAGDLQTMPTRSELEKG